MSEKRKSKTGTVIKPTSDLKGEYTQELKQNLLDLLRKEDHKIILDMSKVKAIDGQGFALLVGAFKSIDRAGGIFEIKNVAGKLRPLFDYSRLNRYFQILPKK